MEFEAVLLDTLCCVLTILLSFSYLFLAWLTMQCRREASCWSNVCLTTCQLSACLCVYFVALIIFVREQLKKQEEMVARQEEMRRKTAEHEAKFHTRTELAKAKAAKGRIMQERQNHDLILQKVRLEVAERCDTILKAIEDGGKLVGQGLSSYLGDVEKLRNTALTVTGIAVGIYMASTSIGVAGRFEKR